MTPNIPEVQEPFSAYLLIGSNIGQREKNLEMAVELFASNNIEILISSSIYESAAWGKEDQQNFLNQVIKVDTFLGPWDLLNAIMNIEIEMGRERKEKWGERIIDIDILYFEEIVIQSFDLLIPHPGIPERRFTLVPLVEIASNKKHPKLNLSQQELLDKCPDQLWVKKWD